MTKATRTERIQVRVTPEVKEKSEALFRRCGLSMSDAVNMFLHQSLNADGLPFTVDGSSKSIEKQSNR